MLDNQEKEGEKMPYIPKRSKYDKSKKLLLAYEITPTRLKAILGVSQPTARKKLNDIGSLTTEDWGLISRKAHIPVEEIRSVFLG